MHFTELRNLSKGINCSLIFGLLLVSTSILRLYLASAKMLLNRISVFAVYSSLCGLINAQFPPTPERVTVLESHIEDGIRISYKEVPNVKIANLRSATDKISE